MIRVGRVAPAAPGSASWPPWPGSAGRRLDGLHFFLADLDGPDRHDAPLLLSADELARASRFRFAVHRNRYVRGRALLRRVLADLTGSEPGAVQFAYGPHGKPEFADDAAAVRFNIAHTGSTALIGVGSCARIGVDIEAEASFEELADLAERQFSPAEFRAWRSVDAADSRHAFYLAWTRKEAFIKATGEGLSRPLDSFDVELRPGEPARFLRTPAEFAGERWSLLNLEPGAGLAAAAAVEWDEGVTPRQVRLWSLQ